MDKYIYEKFQNAKSSKNVYEMEVIYNKCPNDLIVKFEYARLLIQKRRIQEGKNFYWNC